MGVITWSPLNSGWLTGRYRRGIENPPSPRVAIRINRPRDESESGFGRPRASYGTLHDYDAPFNQRKLDVVEELVKLSDDAGISMVDMAVAFTLAHPAVTSSIIGPRTMTQLESQLGSADLTLDTAVLDRIDALVAPGTDVFMGDAGYLPPELMDPRRRRRP
jgi:aryl-alcohol dehydrogenase-like predicted oxidoreductase